MHHDPTVTLGAARAGPAARRPISAAVTVVLLVLPAIAAVAVPLYARVSPRLGGVPFFYWYQFGCLLLMVLCMSAALRFARSRPESS